LLELIINSLNIDLEIWYHKGKNHLALRKKLKKRELALEEKNQIDKPTRLISNEEYYK